MQKTDSTRPKRKIVAKKKPIDFRIQLRKDLDKADYDDKVFLKSTRDMIKGTWFQLLDVDCFGQKQIDDKSEWFTEFEGLLKIEIEQHWGPCLVLFDRKIRKVFVEAASGMKMELISGECYI